MIQIKINDLSQEYRIRYLSIMLMLSIMWSVFFLIVGLDVMDIDQESPRFELNQGPYRLEHIHSLGGPKQAASSYYRLSGNDINIRVEKTKYESIPTHQLEHAVVVKDRSRFYPKYYFASVTYLEKQSQCNIIMMQVCRNGVQEKTVLVNLDKINHEIMETFLVMFLIWIGFSLFGILLGLFG